MTWSVRGIDDEVRETALAAARRSGKPVGEWLNTVIRETATREAPPAQPQSTTPDANAGMVEDLQRNLSDLTQRLERLKSARSLPPAPRPTRGPGRVQENLDEIAAELDRHLDRPRPAAPQPRARVETTFVEEPTQRPQARSPQPNGDQRLSAVLAALETLDRRLQSIADVPAERPAVAAAPQPRPAPAPVPPFIAEPRTAMRRPAEPAPMAAVAMPARRIPEPKPIDDLERAIEEIGQRQRVLDPEIPTGPIIRPAARPIVASDIDRHFRQLAERLDRMDAAPSAAAAPATGHLEAELRDLRAMVEDGFARRLAPLQETVAGLGASLRRVEDRLVQDQSGAALDPVLSEIAALRRDLAGLAPNQNALRSIELGYGDIRERIDDLRQSTSEARFDPSLIDGIRAEISEVRTAIETTSSAGLTGIENRLAAIGRRIDQMVAGRGEALAAVDGIREAIASIPAPEPVDFSRIDQRFDALDRNLAGISAIEDQVGRLSRYLEAMGREPGGRPDLSQQVVEDIAALSARIEALAAEPSEDDREIRQGLGDIVHRLEAIGGRIDQMEQRQPITAVAPDAVVHKGLAIIAQRLEEVGRRVEQIEQRPATMANGDDGALRRDLSDLVGKLEEINHRIGQFPGAPAVATSGDDAAVMRGLSDIVERLEDIGGRIDLLERRAAATPATPPVYDPEDLALKAAEAISARIDALADRMDRLPAAVTTTDPDQNLMAAIDERFARIVRQLDTAEDRFSSLGAIEDTLTEIRTVLTTRSPAGDPTRAAMREAVAEFVKLSQDEGPAAAVASLASELNSLKSQTRDLEARTSDGLRAVQEALTSVAGLLQTRQFGEARNTLRPSGREDTRPIEPGSGKPPAVAEPMVAPRLSLEAETEEARDAQPLRRADFIAAARRAAQAAQAAKLGEPVPADEAGGLQDTVTVSRQPGALARIGAALRGRAKPVAIIVGVLLLAGIATELTLSNMDAVRRGIANAPSPMALLEKFRAPDPVRTAGIAPRKDGASMSQVAAEAPLPAPVATAAPAKDEARSLAPLPTPMAEKAIDPAPLAPQPVQPSTFGKETASALVNRFLPTAKNEPAKPEAPRADVARVAPAAAPEPRSIDVAAAPVATPPAMDPVTTQGIGQRVAEPLAVPTPVEAKPAQEIKPVAALTPIKTPLPALDDKIGSQALRKAASQGDARAAFEIGIRYAEGRGVTQNGATALEWYRRAAEAGFAPAQYRLASALEKGLAGTRDLNEARRWYQTAAEKGNVRAMHNLGVLYANDRDMTTALQWFEKAAARGQKDSQFNLGIVNALGSGVKQDVATSYKWFSLAAQQGDLEATKKRDDIEQYLDKTTLASAKMAVSTWKPETVDRDTNDETTPWTEAVIGDQSLGSAGEKVARVQTLLKTQGKFAGEVDGRLTPETKTAVKAFQRKVGLKPTGEVDDALIRALTSKTG